MTLSKTTEYALRILTLMAAENEKKFSSLYIHNELKIPKKYLQRLLTDLSKYGLIKSLQGRNGGFILAKKAKKIKIAEIIDAVEGFKKEPSCFFGFEKCARNKPCAMHDVWAKSQEDLIKILKSTSLDDISRK